MILKNFYTIMSNVLINKSIPGGRVNTSGYAYDASYHTNYAKYFSLAGLSVTGNIKSSTAEAFFAFGTGTEAPKFDDITLSGDVLPLTTIAVTAVNQSPSDGSYAETLFTVTNISSEAITIGEVATLAAYGCMIERTVLETPLTIQPDGVGQITYHIDFDFPTE